MWEIKAPQASSCSSKYYYYSKEAGATSHAFIVDLAHLSFLYILPVCPVDFSFCGDPFRRWTHTAHSTHPSKSVQFEPSNKARVFCFAVVDLDSLFVLCVTFPPIYCEKDGDLCVRTRYGLSSSTVTRTQLYGHGSCSSSCQSKWQKVRDKTYYTVMICQVPLLVHKQYKVRHEQVQRMKLPMYCTSMYVSVRQATYIGTWAGPTSRHL